MGTSPLSAYDPNLNPLYSPPSIPSQSGHIVNVLRSPVPTFHSAARPLSDFENLRMQFTGHRELTKEEKTMLDSKPLTEINEQLALLKAREPNSLSAGENGFIRAVEQYSTDRLFRAFPATTQKQPTEEKKAAPQLSPEDTALYDKKSRKEIETEIKELKNAYLFLPKGEYADEANLTKAVALERYLDTRVSISDAKPTADAPTKSSQIFRGLISLYVISTAPLNIPIFTLTSLVKGTFLTVITGERGKITAEFESDRAYARAIINDFREFAAVIKNIINPITPSLFAVTKMPGNEAVCGLDKTSPPQLVLQRLFDRLGFNATMFEFNTPNPEGANLFDFTNPLLLGKLITKENGVESVNWQALDSGSFIDEELLTNYLTAILTELPASTKMPDAMLTELSKGISDGNMKAAFKKCVDLTTNPPTIIAAPINELQQVYKAKVSLRRISDDSVQTGDIYGVCATNQNLIDRIKANPNDTQARQELRKAFATQLLNSYKNDIYKLERGHGGSISDLQTAVEANPKVSSLVYDPKKGNGCGAAMRSGPLALFFPGAKNRDALITAAIDAAVTTHAHPWGIIGSICNPLITSMIAENIPFWYWEETIISHLTDKTTLDSAFKAACPPGTDKVKKKQFTEQWNYAIDALRLGKAIPLNGSISVLGQPLDNSPKGVWAFLMQIVALRDNNSLPKRTDRGLEGARNPSIPTSNTGTWPGRNGHDVTVGAIRMFRLVVQDIAPAIESPSQLKKYLEEHPEVRPQLLASVAKYAAFNNGDSDSFAGIVGSWIGAAVGSSPDDIALTGLPDNLRDEFTQNKYS